jgi:methanogenic corrinoid protein MtbC1
MTIRWPFIVAAAVLSLPLVAADTQRPAYNSDIITLREYVDVRFAAEEESVKTALASADRANTKAEAAADKRFDSVNEFRKTLTDETATFLPRAEYNQASKAMEEKVNELTTRVTAAENRSAGLSQAWGYLVAAFGIVVGAVSIYVLLTNRKHVA